MRECKISKSRDCHEVVKHIAPSGEVHRRGDYWSKAEPGIWSSPAEGVPKCATRPGRITLLVRSVQTELEPKGHSR